MCLPFSYLGRRSLGNSQKLIYPCPDLSGFQNLTGLFLDIFEMGILLFASYLSSIIFIC